MMRSAVSVCKMECLTINKYLDHFALRAKLYAKVTRSAFDECRFLGVRNIS